MELGRNREFAALIFRRRGFSFVDIQTDSRIITVMQIVNKRVPSTISILFSVTMIGLFFILGAYGSVVSRWGAMFSGVFELLLASLIWFVWVGHLGFILLARDFKSMARWLLFLSLVLASFFVGEFASEFGRFARAREIQRAVDAGLREDCMQLLLRWLINGSEIDYSEPEYSKLPESIKMLEPCYVENDSIEDTNLTPNIGICKNGFGGFAEGVRVFRSDQDAKTFENQTLGGCERIAPGVYFWWHPT
jgi:hypothetical protein